MVFAVILLPTDVEGPPPAYQAAAEAAVRERGGSIDGQGRIRLRDGGRLRFADNSFRVQALSPAACAIVFDTAVRTNTYVTNEGGGEDLAPLRVAGSEAVPPREMGPAVLASTPRALCARLRVRLAHWTRETRRMRRDGVIGVDGQLLEPPAGPGDEPRLASDPSGLAASCEARARDMVARTGWRFVRSVVTRSPTWGVVWRADIAPQGDDPARWFRDICWRSSRGGGGLRVSNRPLQMFDPAQSVGPLPAE